MRGSWLKLANMQSKKKPRLLDFALGSHVSQRALAQLLVKAKNEGIPDAVSRSTYYRNRKSATSVSTPYGDLLTDMQLPTGKTITVQNPAAMIYIACK